MAVRTIKGTLDTLEIDAGSEITYKGGSLTGNESNNARAFQVNPGGTGSLIVDIDQSSGVSKLEIFQEDSYTGSSRATGYQTITNIGKAGKGKGAVAVTVTDASKNYLVMLTLSGYSEVAYSGSVTVP
jgi:hypothetical protein